MMHLNAFTLACPSPQFWGTSTLVLTAEFDLLHPQGRDYAAKLHAAGVETDHVMVPGALHGFFTSQVGLQQSVTTTERIVAFIDQIQSNQTHTNREAQP